MKPKKNRQTDLRGDEGGAVPIKISAIDRPKSLTDQAYVGLKAAIREGSVVQGRFYPLGDVALQLGISRTPIREAVLKLEHEGLVEIVPQRGFRVRYISPDEAADVFELRSLIEGLAVEKLARRAGPEEIRTLRAVLNRQERVLGETGSFLNIDEEFHLRIAELAGLRRARDFLSSLRDVVWLLGFEALGRPGRAAEVLAEHTRIVDSIESKDAAKARRAIDAHLDSTYAKIKAATAESSRSGKEKTPVSRGRH